MNRRAFYVMGRRGGYGIGPRPDTCADCGAHFGPQPAHRCTTGYGTEAAGTVDAATFERMTGEPAPALKAGERIEMARAVCFDCCGRADVSAMRATGRATLYLTKQEGQIFGRTVCNWPGTLSIITGDVAHHKRAGGFGSNRTDVWFDGPDGYRWHGVNRGDNDILRCRRTRERVHA